MSTLQVDPIFGKTSQEFATFVFQEIYTREQLEHWRSKDYISPRWSHIIMPRLVTLAIIVCMVASGMTVVVIYQSHLKPEPLVDEPPRRIISHQVCMQCVKLFKDQLNQQGPDPLVDKLIKRVDDGIQMCCADSDDQLSTLLEASLQEQVPTPVFTFKTFGSRGKRSPAVAHKQLILNSELKSNLTGKPLKLQKPRLFAKFNKDNDDTHTEHVRGVTVLDTALEIEHTGSYYVYLSVDLAQTPSKHSLKHQTWRHYVCLERPEHLPQTRTLLSVSDTQSNHLSHYQETTFLGGTFYLEKGDRLSVILGDLDFVQYRREATYIGLFLLSS